MSEKPCVFCGRPVVITLRAAIDMAVAAERERIAQALESQVIDAASGVIAVRWAARIARDPALRAGSE